MKNCPVNIKSPVQIQKWVCDSAHPIGCVEHDGFYYFNRVAGNTVDPNIGVGNGSYNGGFTLCGLMTWLANQAINEFHDEEYDAMLASFFSCLQDYKAGTSYSAGNVVVNNGVIFESLVDTNTADVSDASKWETYGTPCTILTSMKIDSEGNAVLGEDCQGNPVIAGASIATCSDLNSAISLLDERVTAEVNTLNTRIDSEVQTLNQTIVDGDTALDNRITSEVQTLNQTIVDGDTALDNRITSEVQTLNQTIVDGDTALQLQIDTNSECCATNAENIAINAQSIADNAAGVAANATGVAVNAANISSNTNSIVTNAAQIAQNVQDISDNETAIAVNTTDISNLQSDVSNLETKTDANTVCCATNSADIDSLGTDVSDLQSDVQSNSVNIAVNAANTDNNTTEITTKQDKLQDCNGSDLSGQVPTCSQMNDTIADAISGIVFPEPEVYSKCGGDNVDGDLVQCDQFEGLLAAALSDDETCYDLPVLDSACDITKVAFAEVNGCGKLFKYTKDPLPQGMQFITRGVSGTLSVPLDGTGTWDGDFFWSGGSNPDNNIQYKVFEACKTFTKADFCLLGTTGRTVQIVADTRVGYYIDSTETYSTRSLLPYQFLTEVSANGTSVRANTDAYAINPDGGNHHQTDLIEGEWDTDGDDVTICVKVGIVAGGSSTGTFGNHADTYEMDMAQISITMNLV